MNRNAEIIRRATTSPDDVWVWYEFCKTFSLSSHDELVELVGHHAASLPAAIEALSEIMEVQRRQAQAIDKPEEAEGNGGGDGE